MENEAAFNNTVFLQQPHLIQTQCNGNALYNFQIKSNDSAGFKFWRNGHLFSLNQIYVTFVIWQTCSLSQSPFLTIISIICFVCECCWRRSVSALCLLVGSSLSVREQTKWVSIVLLPTQPLCSTPSTTTPLRKCTFMVQPE